MHLVDLLHRRVFYMKEVQPSPSSSFLPHTHVQIQLYAASTLSISVLFVLFVAV